MSNWWNSFLPSTRTFLFQLFMTRHKTKREIDKSLLPSKNNVLWFGTCVRVEELIFLAFLMKSLHQPVSNKTVKLWRLGTWFMDLILHKCFVIHWKPASRTKHVCNCVSIPRDKGPVKPIDFCSVSVQKKMLSYGYNEVWEVWGFSLETSFKIRQDTSLALEWKVHFLTPRNARMWLQCFRFREDITL